MKKILVVEDSKVAQQKLKTDLFQLGFKEVEMVSAGEEALKFVQYNQVDLIIMDIILEGEMSGITAAKKINTQFDIPIIYLTEGNEDYLDLPGAAVFLAKPFTKIELKNNINIVLDKHKIKSDLRENKIFLENIFNSIQAGLVVLDTNLDIVRTNPWIDDLYDSYDEIKGKKCYQIFHHRDSPCKECPVIATLKTGEKHRGELKTKDGKWLELFSYPLENEQGEIEGVIEYINDITARKETEKELIQVNEIIESSPAVIFKWKNDLEWGVEFVSKNVEQFGYTPQQFKEKELVFSDIIYKEDLARVKEEVNTNSEHGKDRFKQHYRIVTADGEVRWIDDWTIVVRDDLGEISHYHGIIIDVTERVQAEQKIRDNERRWKFALESSQYGIWDWDLKQEKVYFSPIWKEMLGYEEEEITNKLSEWKARVHPDDLEEAMGKIKRHLAGETEYYQDEHRMKNKSGNYIWIKDRGKVVEWTEKGEPLRFIGTHEDITARKKVEKELQESEERYRGLVESQQDLIVRVDNNNKFTYVNQAYCDTFGKTKEELVGSSFTPLIHEDDRADTLEAMEELKTSPYRVYIEQRAMTVDGWRWIAWEDYAIRDENGEIKEIQGVGRDITELKEAQQKAEAANKAKSEFLANMSHEIRTPLSAVIGFSELLEKMTEDSKQLKYLESIKTAGNTLLTLINDILDLSKIEAGQLEINYQKFELYSLLIEIKQIFKQKCQEKGLDFELDIAFDDEIAIKLDETRLRQILLNLVGNAVKFTKQGYVRLAVDYELKADKLNLKIIVEDSGIGIPKAEQEDIFKAFKQQDSQSTREYGGTGLGLSITKRLTEMMDGKLYLDSQAGMGSTFTVKFADVEYRREDNKTEEEIGEEHINFSAQNILVVDDIESNRDLVQAILSDSALNVSTAKNGQAGLKLAQEKEFALILMDLKMPKMDGYEVTKKIKEDSLNLSTPIIALTASVTEKERQKVSAEQFAEFISKPIDKEQLISTLANYLEHQKINKQRKTEERELTAEFSDGVKDNDRLKEILKQSFKPKYQKIGKPFIINEVEDFADNLYEVAQEYNAENLSNYAVELKDDLESFNVTEAKEKFKKFTDIIAEIGE
ncbi:PAS domain S-box protein [Halanaerobacter jeridensis]|uniref:Circadian input-output histidine kinase CikA n=1 Tax=Halanaerobacter jeridensis TaxID=706427 RepID=A0A938XR08_9FIRM|nr:PAS domain S-box protein [Halanaerobacter jeridensis]MBM7555783.1 PAS domain S-box-containing protein [Halanaerobacter jeridensis]